MYIDVIKIRKFPPTISKEYFSFSSAAIKNKAYDCESSPCVTGAQSPSTECSLKVGGATPMAPTSFGFGV